MQKYEKLVVFIETNKQLQIWLRDNCIALQNENDQYCHLVKEEYNKFPVHKWSKGSYWFIKRNPILGSMYDIHGFYWRHIAQ